MAVSSNARRQSDVRRAANGNELRKSVMAEYIRMIFITPKSEVVSQQDVLWDDLTVWERVELPPGATMVVLERIRKP